MAELVVTGLTRTYGNVRAVDDISFKVNDGELVTLLGPSGCGKSTTLFSIAGLDRPTAGQIRVGPNIFFDATRGIHLPPESRNCGLVFQSYALWPHMTVKDNVAFPLKLRKITGAQLLLLDEPLSNLDAKLRLRARGWLRELQTRLKITTLYVTHDQEEALALSDRIAVMSVGKIVQLGTPREIYLAPATPFIADFVGHSNILFGAPARDASGSLGLRLADSQFIALDAQPCGAPSERLQVAIRPEHIALHAGGGESLAQNVLRGRIIQRDFLGTRFEYLIQIGESVLRVTRSEELAVGDVLAELPKRHCMPFWEHEKQTSPN